jgi:hypothetical protein
MAPGGDWKHDKAASYSSHDEKPHAPTPGTGMPHLEGLLRYGMPSPQIVAQLIAKFPAEQRETMMLLHTALGNAYVQRVVTVLKSDTRSHRLIPSDSPPERMSTHIQIPDATHPARTDTDGEQLRQTETVRHARDR